MAYSYRGPYVDFRSREYNVKLSDISGGGYESAFSFPLSLLPAIRLQTIKQVDDESASRHWRRPPKLPACMVHFEEANNLKQ
jgi:hypothetical protein